MGLFCPCRPRQRADRARQDYVTAADCLGLPRWRVLFGHILPNCMAPVIIIGTHTDRPRHRPRGHSVLPRHRPSGNTALARPADRQRLSGAVRELLDELFSRPAAAHPRFRSTWLATGCARSSTRASRSIMTETARRRGFAHAFLHQRRRGQGGRRGFVRSRPRQGHGASSANPAPASRSPAFRSSASSSRRGGGGRPILFKAGSRA